MDVAYNCLLVPGASNKWVTVEWVSHITGKLKAQNIWYNHNCSLFWERIRNWVKRCWLYHKTLNWSPWLLLLQLSQIPTVCLWGLACMLLLVQLSHTPWPSIMIMCSKVVNKVLLNVTLERMKAILTSQLLRFLVDDAMSIVKLIMQ